MRKRKEAEWRCGEWTGFSPKRSSVEVDQPAGVSISQSLPSAQTLALRSSALVLPNTLWWRCSAGDPDSF